MADEILLIVDKADEDSENDEVAVSEVDAASKVTPPVGMTAKRGSTLFVSSTVSCTSNGKRGAHGTPVICMKSISSPGIVSSQHI